MARRVVEGRQLAGKASPPMTATAGGQCGRGANDAAEHERARVAKETAHTGFVVAHQSAFLSGRRALRLALERRSTVTLATRGRRVKEVFDRAHRSEEHMSELLSR